MKYISALMLALVIGSLALTATVAAASTASTTDQRVRDIVGNVQAIQASVGISAQGTLQVPGVGDPAAFVPPVVGALPTTTPAIDTSHLQQQIAGMASSAISGSLDTSAIGPMVKCGILAPIGWPIPTFSSECSATTTPPGPPGTTTPPGGGTTTPPGGGGTSTTTEGVGGSGDSSSSGSSSGGGSGGSSGGSSGSTAPGEVLGAETAVAPGAPNTGAGGQAPATLFVLIASLLTAFLGAASWYSLAHRGQRLTY